MTRGTLRIYLGAAPGVGKTYAMLDEAHRRKARGTDVVVALVETHGRARTRAMVGDLEVLPAQDRRPTAAPSSTRWTSTRSWPGARGRLRRRAGAHQHPGLPQREALAGRRGAARRRHHRAVDGQHPAPRVAQRRRREDHRRPPAGDRARLGRARGRAGRAGRHHARRRCAGGWRTATSTPPDKVDAALGNYFRVGNLTALRELALLWLADKVDDALQQYRKDHHIADTWETRERVVVALTGGPEGETLIRRGRAHRGARRRRPARRPRQQVGRADRREPGRARRAASAGRITRRQLPRARRRQRLRSR